jgi:hypothetical protein
LAALDPIAEDPTITPASAACDGGRIVNDQDHGGASCAAMLGPVLEPPGIGIGCESVSVVVPDRFSSRTAPLLRRGIRV